MAAVGVANASTGSPIFGQNCLLNAAMANKIKGTFSSRVATYVPQHDEGADAVTDTQKAFIAGLPWSRVSHC